MTSLANCLVNNMPLTALNGAPPHPLPTPAHMCFVLCNAPPHLPPLHMIVRSAEDPAPLPACFLLNCPGYSRPGMPT